MPKPSIVSPHERWTNPDGTPTVAFYRFIFGLPGVPVPPPTVSGAKAGNAALTSLISVLKTAGVITDATT